MSPLLVLAAIAFGYLFGSIPFSKLVGKLSAGQSEVADIDVAVPCHDETYKVTAKGAAAVSMSLGARAGCLQGFLDMAKVAIPTLVFKLLYPQDPYLLIAAAAGMVGHIWPVFNRFKGGRGISSVYGALFVIDWIGAFAVATGGLLIGLFIARDFIIAYLSGLWLLIFWAWFLTHDFAYLGYALFVNVIFVIAMIPDLRQYIKFRKDRQVDLSLVMSMTPMGRGMQRIMQFGRLRRH